MPPLRIIGLLLNAFCVTSRLQPLMVCTSLGILPCLFMVSQMLIGLVVLTIANPQVVIVKIIKLKHKKEARILNNMYIMSA
jgi:hypothetical protein